MTAVILAAGHATRMSGVVGLLHKSILTVRGRSVIGRMVEQLCGLGVNKLVVVVGHNGPEVESCVRQECLSIGRRMDLTIVRNESHRSTGTSVSLSLGLAAVESTALILDGDLLLSSDALECMVTLRSAANILVECRKEPCAMDVKVYQENGHLIEMSKKVVPDKEISGEFFGVSAFGASSLTKLRKRLAETIERSEGQAWYEDAIVDLARQTNVSLVKCTSDWWEIDSPEDFSAAQSISWIPQ